MKTKKPVRCAFCGNPFPLARFISGDAVQRFGRPFCSRQHLTQFADGREGYFAIPSLKGHAMIEFR